MLKYNPGVRSSKHSFYRGECKALGRGLQSRRSRLSNKVCSEFLAVSLINPSRNFSFEDVHVEGTERIAEAVAKYDIDRFIHVSTYNANKNSSSEFFRTKARGEEVVRSIFPETTIVRPAPMFGFEDRLLHRLAGVANLFTSNNMQERFWPVHVSCWYFFLPKS